MKKLLSLFLLVAFLIALAACKKDSASVYLLNFKPESEQAFKDLATEYEKQTGVKVKVVTAAEGKYEEKLTAEMLKPEKPTIFTINGPVGLEKWKNYTLALDKAKANGYEDFSILDQLSNSNLTSAVTMNGNVYGLPITVEGYGLVYNKTVFTEYFAQTNKATTLTSVDDISNFQQLKTVVEDLTAYIDGTKTCTSSCPTIEGLDGVFAPTMLKEGNEWPYQTHLSNIPFYFEFKEHNADNPLKAGLDLNSIEFKYNENMKNTFDLYNNNNAIDPADFSGADYNTAVVSFATEKSAIIQQGNWVYSAINDAQGKTITDSQLGMMPIYTGISGEENYTIPVGTENFWSINKKASKEDINASIKFINWMFTDTKAKKIVTNDLGFMAPFKTFTEDEMPSNPLAKEVIRLSSIDNKSIIPWVFGAYPSQDWKDTFGGDLLDYTQGDMTWQQVVNDVKTDWADQKSTD